MSPEEVKRRNSGYPVILEPRGDEERQQQSTNIPSFVSPEEVKRGNSEYPVIIDITGNTLIVITTGPPPPLHNVDLATNPTSRVLAHRTLTADPFWTERNELEKSKFQS